MWPAEPKRKYENPPQTDWLCGSGEIARLIIEGKDESHWAKTYARQVPRDGSFEDLKSLAKGFIEACSDSIAPAIDPVCKGIDGRIHIARLTQLGGFEWVKGFEPLTFDG